MSDSEKVALITGANKGLGLEISRQLGRKGISVIIGSRDAVKGQEAAELLLGEGLKASAVKLDVCNDADIAALPGLIRASHGRLDILINNAGVSMRALFKDLEVEVIEKVMGINFSGTLYCTKLALNSIIERKGTIVGVSSIAGFRGLPGRSGYSASKFAVNGFLEALRTELIDSGVNVMWVCPGFTASNIRNAALNRKGQSQGESPMDEGKMMSSAACAEHILTAIEKRKRTLVLTFTGRRAVFMNKFFPGLADRLTKNFFFKKGELVR